MRHGFIHPLFDLVFCSNRLLQSTSCSPPPIILLYATQVFTALFLIHTSEVLIYFNSVLFVLFW